MLERQYTPQEETPPAHLPPEPSLYALLPTQSEAVLVGYLAQSHSEDADLDTVHTYLEELTRAYLELDIPPDEAAHSAIRQWEAERQARGERQTLSVQSQPPLSTLSARPATFTALKLFRSGVLALTTIVPLLIGASIRGTNTLDTRVFYSLLLFLIFGQPVLLGIAVGMRARQRPALGTFYALALLAPLAALISEVTVDMFVPFHRPGAFLGLWLLKFWLPIGCLTAGLTGWGRDLYRKRRRDAVNRLASMPKAEPAAF